MSIFKSIFASPNRSSAEDNDPAGAFRTSVAALLVEAARADDHYAPREIEIIDKSLAASFDLSAEDAAALRAEGEKAQSGALDIHRFTRVAKQMTAEEKTAFVEQLWEIVLSDGDRDPYEDALIRRICGLIYVDDRESGAARARVAARLSPS